MELDSSQDIVNEAEEAAALCFGELDWEPVGKWFDVQGHRVIRQVCLEEKHMYWAWLAEQLGCPLTPAPTWEAASHVALVPLRASCGREAGYRNVKPEGLRKKMRDIMVAKAWREWDKAVLCRVPELDAEEASSAGSAEASGDAPEAASQHRRAMKTIRYIDFHHRACAMHFVAYSFNDRAMDLPGWFLALAKQVPVEHKGTLSKLEWRSLGLGRAASQQHGQVGLSWMDILQIILEEPAWAMSGCANLQDRVFQISPEYAAKLSDWKNMKTLANSGPQERVRLLGDSDGRDGDEQSDSSAYLASRSPVRPQDGPWQGRPDRAGAAGGREEL